MLIRLFMNCKICTFDERFCSLSGTKSKLMNKNFLTTHEWLSEELICWKWSGLETMLINLWLFVNQKIKPIDERYRSSRGKKNSWWTTLLLPRMNGWVKSWFGWSWHYDNKRCLPGCSLTTNFDLWMNGFVHWMDEYYSWWTKLFWPRTNG